MKIKKLDESNELHDRAKRHKKSNKGLSPYCTLNPDAGNVEHNVSMFNKMSNPVEGPSNNPISGPHGGEVGGVSESVSTPEEWVIIKKWNDARLRYRKCWYPRLYKVMSRTDKGVWFRAPGFAENSYVPVRDVVYSFDNYEEADSKLSTMDEIIYETPDELKESKYMEESSMEDFVELHYDDLEVRIKTRSQGPSSYYFEYGRDEAQYAEETVTYDYSVPKSEIVDFICEIMTENDFADIDTASEDEIVSFINANFDTLFDKYGSMILDYYRADAEKDAERYMNESLTEKLVESVTPAVEDFLTNLGQTQDVEVYKLYLRKDIDTDICEKLKSLRTAYNRYANVDDEDHMLKIVSKVKDLLNSCPDRVYENLVEASNSYIIMAVTNDSKKQYYNMEYHDWVQNGKDATIFDDMDEARVVWFKIDKKPFKRVFIPNYDPDNMNESVSHIDVDKQYATDLLVDQIYDLMNWNLSRQCKVIALGNDTYRVTTNRGNVSAIVKFDISDPDKNLVFTIDKKGPYTAKNDREAANIILRCLNDRYAKSFNLFDEGLSDDIRSGNLEYDDSVDAWYAKDGDTEIQLQDRESHTHEFRTSENQWGRSYVAGQYNKQPKVASRTWGRVWKDGNLVKQFEGPKYQVRADMAKYLDADEKLDEAKIPDNWTQCSYRESLDEFSDELDHPDQEFDSAKTSINSTKLPAVYKMVKIPQGTTGVDFGGGSFDNAVEHIRDLGATLCVYDPYNRSAEHNSEVIKTLKSNGGADWAINSNVLNVIKEPEARKAVLKNISRITKSGAPVYITVYEGRGDGQEGATKSGYQLNRKTQDYLAEIQEVFPDAVRKGKLIVAHNGRGRVNESNNAYSYKDCTIIDVGSGWKVKDASQNWVGNEFATDKDAEEFVDSLHESFLDSDDNYEFISSKSVLDSDGFYTDYTWYKTQDGLNVFVFGDNDIYKPADGYIDHEEEDDAAAQEWFDSYNGFEEDIVIVDEGYNVKFYQVFRAPESPTELGKMVAQAGTAEEAKSKGEKLCGQGNYFIKGVCDDGKTRYLESWNEFSDDDVEDDLTHAAVYGGDSKYCKECGAVKKYDEDGFAYCPECCGELDESCWYNDHELRQKQDELIAELEDDGFEEIDGRSHGTKHWTFFRKRVDGKGKWKAIFVDTSSKEASIMDVTYGQVRGFEPLDDVERLSKELGSKLLPR